MPHATGSSDLGVGTWISLQSLLSQNWEALVPLSSSQMLQAPSSQTPSRTREWASQTTDTHRDRLPLCGKKGHFYLVSFWLIVIDCFEITSHLAQRWPPCIH